MTYDTWKTRSDLDETPPEPEEEFEPEPDPEAEAEDRDYECSTCEQLNGSHAPGCPDSPGYGDHIDAEIDRLQDLEP